MHTLGSSSGDTRNKVSPEAGSLSIEQINAVAEKPSYGRVPHCSEGERIPDFSSIVWVKIVFASRRGRTDAAQSGQDGQSRA